MVTNPLIPTSKSDRPNTSRKVTNTAVSLESEAEPRAWATVNKETGGGKKSGSGRGKPTNTEPSRKGGKLGGKAAASRPATASSEAAKKAAATRKHKAQTG